MTDLYKAVIGVVLVLLVIGGAAFAGYYFTKSKPVVETARAGETQVDGSVIAPRVIDPRVKPRQIIKPKTKVERVAQIVVQGQTPEANLKPGSSCVACPPVTIDTTLTRNQDGSKNLLISSPDGRILKSVDFPVETAAPPPEPKKWAAGLAYNPTMQTAVAWVDRDVMRVRLGVQANQSRQVRGGPTGMEYWLKLGINF